MRPYIHARNERCIAVVGTSHMSSRKSIDFERTAPQASIGGRVAELCECHEGHTKHMRHQGLATGSGRSVGISQLWAGARPGSVPLPVLPGGVERLEQASLNISGYPGSDAPEAAAKCVVASCVQSPVPIEVDVRRFSRQGPTGQAFGSLGERRHGPHGLRGDQESDRGQS